MGRANGLGMTIWMQTTGATLLRVRRCSLARTWMLARSSRSAYGLLYLAAVRGDGESMKIVGIGMTGAGRGSGWLCMTISRKPRWCPSR